MTVTPPTGSLAPPSVSSSTSYPKLQTYPPDCSLKLFPVQHKTRKHFHCSLCFGLISSLSCLEGNKRDFGLFLLLHYDSYFCLAFSVLSLKQTAVDFITEPFPLIRLRAVWEESATTAGELGCLMVDAPLRTSRCWTISDFTLDSEISQRSRGEVQRGAVTGLHDSFCR